MTHGFIAEDLFDLQYTRDCIGYHWQAYQVPVAERANYYPPACIWSRGFAHYLFEEEHLQALQAALEDIWAMPSPGALRCGVMIGLRRRQTRT